MIDKYKQPRVQRLVPERHPLQSLNDPAVRLQEALAGYWRAQKNYDAMVSGAMPGDFVTQELRPR